MNDSGKSAVNKAAAIDISEDVVVIFNSPAPVLAKNYACGRGDRRDRWVQHRTLDCRGEDGKNKARAKTNKRSGHETKVTRIRSLI